MDSYRKGELKKNALSWVNRILAQVRPGRRAYAIRRGNRSSATSCPLANTFRDFSGFSEVNVNASKAVINGYEVRVPPSVGDFVNAVDAGEYPELERAVY